MSPTLKVVMRGAGFVAALALVVWGIRTAVRRDDPAVEAEAVEILGGPVNLAAEGDTLTICGVARMSDGSYQLGHVALLLRADTDSTVIAYPKALDVRERCAPRLRARGLPVDLPLVEMQWDQMPGVRMLEAVT